MDNQPKPSKQDQMLLAKFDVEVKNHVTKDGNWIPMLSVKAAMGFVEFGVMLNPDICRALAKSLNNHAIECEQHIVVPQPRIVAPDA